MCSSDLQDTIVCRGYGIEKRITFADDGSLDVSWKWESSPFEEGAYFSSEISVTRPLDIQADPAAGRSTMPVETIAKSEKGFERTVQGEAVTLLWPSSHGAARLRIRPYPPQSATGTEAHRGSGAPTPTHDGRQAPPPPT